MENKIIDLKQKQLPTFNSALCTNCGICVECCPESAISPHVGSPKISEVEKCTYCGTCEDTCPQGAVELEFQIY